MLTVISLGAGVQSTTMALMAGRGEIGPMPDAAIFADTGWEPKAVYDHLAWLMSPGVLPFPVHVVSAGDLRADILNRSNTTGGRFAAVPWFMRMPNGDQGMGRRQCTKEYKLTPIRRKVRELLGGKTPKGGAAIRKQSGFRGEQFMHQQRVPLDQVDLTTAADRGQLDLFVNDCEGMCGV